MRPSSGLGPSPAPVARRTVLRAAAATGLAGGLLAAGAGRLQAAPVADVLRVVERRAKDARLTSYRFETAQVSSGPVVDVLLPTGYTRRRRYPVVYLLHGGVGNHTWFDRFGIREIVGDRQIVVVMPDGGLAGWYSDPVSSNVGARNWETFHVEQLVPWVDATFSTYASAAGRAVAGFSMGGFGALKYAARHRELFSSVSSHSGPASIRRDHGLVTHWANLSSAAVELGGGTVYGVPWRDDRVDADDPVQHVPSYRGRRIFLVAGTSPEPLDLFGTVNEVQVLAGHREFRAALRAAGLPHEWHERPGGHELRRDMLELDLDGIVDRLRSA